MSAHILVVEPKESLARFIELELRCEGYQVSVAHDGPSGLAAVRERPPDLAIWDGDLPSVAQSQIGLRWQAAGYSFPVILLTADEEISRQISTMNGWADAYIAKPFSIEKLLVHIQLLLLQNCRAMIPE